MILLRVLRADEYIKPVKICSFKVPKTLFFLPSTPFKQSNFQALKHFISILIAPHIRARISGVSQNIIGN